MTAAPMPLPRQATLTWRSIILRRRVVLPVVAVLLAVLVGFVGFVVGSNHRSAVHVVTGSAYASSEQISAFSGGWSYEIPLDVRWRASDAAGGWHEGSRPACLPPGRGRVPLKFAWVPVETPDKVGWRAVVWVDCR